MSRITGVDTVLPCAELQPTIDFFVERLAFRLDRISPADDPRSAWLSGHGAHLVLRRETSDVPGTLELRTNGPEREALVAPNGTRIELVPASTEPVVPTGSNELVVTRASDNAWITGRAGMRYRDLIPGRLGGRLIASHIRIEDGGPVPDNVHFHAIRFQLIFCVRGWVRVVYEDQGPPFVLEPGDAVLQPPRIRHRVLESSPGLEVVELACPAEHDTFLDHELELPTSARHPERDFGGQRFVHHVADDTSWSEVNNVPQRSLGLEEPTRGIASACVARPQGQRRACWHHDSGLFFAYVLDGEARIESLAPAPISLSRGDSIVVPAGSAPVLASSTNFEVLEVRC